MNSLKLVLLTAGILLALTFTISCGSSKPLVFKPVAYSDDLTYEGQTYKTVDINGVIWMAENLNYAIADSKCYGDDPANCEKYGRLYSWTTAMALSPDCRNRDCKSLVKPKHQGVCPKGWHLPSSSDAHALSSAAGGGGGLSSGGKTTAKVVKAKEGWNSYKRCEPFCGIKKDVNDDEMSGNGDDNLGFAALPGGNLLTDDPHVLSLGRGYGERFVQIGNMGLWWIANDLSNQNFAHTAGHFSAESRSEGLRYGGANKTDMNSVRCVKD